MRGRPKKNSNAEMKYCVCVNTCYNLGMNKTNAHYCCHYCPNKEKCQYKCIEHENKCKLLCNSKEELESFTSIIPVVQKEKVVKKKEDKIVTIEQITIGTGSKKKRGRPRKK